MKNIINFNIAPPTKDIQLIAIETRTNKRKLKKEQSYSQLIFLINIWIC